MTTDSLADVALDPATWDIALVQRQPGLYDISLVSGAARVQQAVRLRLQVWYQEWAFDLTIGIPFLEQFFIKNPSLPGIESLLRAQILGVTGVDEIGAMTINIDSVARTLAVTYVASTSFGLINDLVPLSQVN